MRAPEDAGIGAEPALPERMPEDRDGGAVAAGVLARAELAADERRRAERLEQVCRHVPGADALGLAAAGQVRLGRFPRADVTQQARALTIVADLGRGHPGLVPTSPAAPDHHAAVWLAVGERGEQHGAEHAEDRARRAHAQRKRDHGDGGKAGLAPQGAQREADVLPDGVHGSLQIGVLDGAARCRVPWPPNLQPITAGLNRVTKSPVHRVDSSWPLRGGAIRPMADDRAPDLPFKATTLSAAYDHVGTLPVSVLIDSVRSLYNVGAFFRTLEAAGGAHLYLAGHLRDAAASEAGQDRARRGADGAVDGGPRRRRARSPRSGHTTSRWQRSRRRQPPSTSTTGGRAFRSASCSATKWRGCRRRCSRRAMCACAFRCWVGSTR